MEIHVLQGERPMARDNRTLGRFQLAGIPPAPRGMPQIEVTFDIDANGILNVSAKDLGTGKEQSIDIKSSSGLSEEEVKKMKRDAEAHAEEDRKAREIIEKRNQADSLAYHVERHPQEARRETRRGRPLRRSRRPSRKSSEAVKADDPARIDRAVETLNQASHALAQMLYQQAGAGAGAAGRAGPQHGPGPDGSRPAGPQGGKGKGGDDVIDAEYEVKN